MSAGKTAVCDTDDAPLWFIGDLHGDFLALLHALHLAHAYDHSLPAHQAGLPPDAPTNLFFLGDFIDEGPHAAEIMAWLLASCAGRSFGGRRFSIMALLGNHDDGLAYDDSLRGFWSHVAPSDFFAQLNAAPDPALANAFGRAVCAFFHELPRMALLDKSILAVHGGVPNATLLSSIRNAADLESADALADYTWGRLLETRPEGITNQREKSGAWIGWREFDRFIEVFARITGAEPRLLLRGHDHKPRNFKWLEHYENCRVLTLNNFTVNGRDPKARKRYRPVTLARANHPRSAPLDVQVFQCDLPPALIEHCRNLPSLLENTTP
ncbi:MAG: metallophosphoesterase [Opitutaceae bacterium]|nr:metallophosphoesterase [Opitutaceae bacterium]